MSDDASYASFLDKANQDTGGPAQNSQAESGQASSRKSAEVPPALQTVNAYYTSDTDEPFEPIALDYNGSSLPDAKVFGEVVAGQSSSVEEMSVEEWDPSGQYGEVVEKVKSASNGTVKIFRVARGKTRAEYYIIAMKDGRLVGMMARAVES